MGLEKGRVVGAGGFGGAWRTATTLLELTTERTELESAAELAPQRLVLRYSRERLVLGHRRRVAIAASIGVIGCGRLLLGGIVALGKLLAALGLALRQLLDHLERLADLRAAPVCRVRRLDHCASRPQR